MSVAKKLLEEIRQRALAPRLRKKKLRLRAEIGSDLRKRLEAKNT